MGSPLKAAKTVKAGPQLIVRVEHDGKLLGAFASAKGGVRWGLGNDADIPIAFPGLSRTEALFENGREAGRLLVRPGMDGEIGAGSTIVPFRDLEPLGILQGKGDERYIEITRHMSGWLSYRDCVVRFEYGEVPADVTASMEAVAARRAAEAEAARAARAAEAEAAKAAKAAAKAAGRGAGAPSGATVHHLPKEFRRQLFSRDDRFFTILSVATYVVLISLAVYLASVKIVEADAKPVVPERFAKLKYQVGQTKTRVKQELERKKQAEEEAKKKAEASRKAVEEKVVEEKAPEPKPEPKAETAQAQQQAAPVQSIEERRAAIRKEVSKKGLLGVLGGRGGAGVASGRASILQGGGRAADLDSVLENVEGLKAGTGTIAGSTADDWKGRRVADAGGALSESARSAAAASARVVELEQRTAIEVESTEVGQLDDLSMKEAVALIHRTVDTYLGGIRYLYNRELRKNPDLEGKVVIAITIDPDGSVVMAEVKETTMNAPDLVDGILARVKRWTFPPVAPKRITVTYPFVFFPSM